MDTDTDTQIAEAEARAVEAERMSDRLARLLVAEIGRREVDKLARETFPTDLYAQTCIVTGLDPLNLLGRDLTAERFRR